MIRYYPALLRTMIFLAVSAAPWDKASAAPPAYLLLRTPPPHRSHRAINDTTSGYAIPLPAQTYSYGWFGATPRQQWSRHFGYYDNYREWSAR